MGDMNISFNKSKIKNNTMKNIDNSGKDNYKKLVSEINEVLETKILSEEEKNYLVNIRDYSDNKNKTNLKRYLIENKEYIFNGAIANLLSGTILAFLNSFLK